MPTFMRWLVFLGLSLGLMTSFSPGSGESIAYNAVSFLPFPKVKWSQDMACAFILVLEVRRMHKRVDFRAKEGTAVYAAGPGRILRAEKASNGYGLMVEIHHDNTYKSRYAHLSKLAAKKGDIVYGGQLIGYSGNTGLSSGPHLHYEVPSE